MVELALVLVWLLAGWTSVDAEQVLASRRTLLTHPWPGIRRLPVDLANRPCRDPELVQWMLPYREWEAEYREYFRRHAGDPSVSFTPDMIVMHYTVADDAAGVWAGFARGGGMWAGDEGVVFGHVSVQLMVDKDGTVYQLLPLHHRATGAYGVNHVALSIELVATDEEDLLSRPEQVFSSFCLVAWLVRRFDIPLDRVHSHTEVALGRLILPEYLDLADSKWPYFYPPESFRWDPGATYMYWLRTFLRKRIPESVR